VAGVASQTGGLEVSGKWVVSGREDQRPPDQAHDLTEDPRRQLTVPKLEVLGEEEL
jgi:hypothetical protein